MYSAVNDEHSGSSQLLQIKLLNIFIYFSGTISEILYITGCTCGLVQIHAILLMNMDTPRSRHFVLSSLCGIIIVVRIASAY